VIRSHHLLYVALLFLGLVVVTGCSEEPTATEPARVSQARDADDVDLSPSGGGMPFADSEIFLEFNSTDNDLGVQVFLDGEDWKRVVIFNPAYRPILDIQPRSEFRVLGLTELRFESAEPSPEEVLELFDPGNYEFAGRTVEGDRLTGTGTLSHELAPAPIFSPSNGEVVAPDNTVIQWNASPGVESWEVIVVNEHTGAELFVELPGEVTSLKVPVNFLDSNTEYKAEVLAILPNGNKTISEGLFYTMP